MPPRCANDAVFHRSRSLVSVFVGFLRTRRYASEVCCAPVSVCPSVRLSQAGIVSTAKLKITQPTPHDSSRL